MYIQYSSRPEPAFFTLKNVILDRQPLHGDTEKKNAKIHLMCPFLVGTELRNAWGKLHASFVISLRTASPMLNGNKASGGGFFGQHHDIRQGSRS